MERLFLLPLLDLPLQVVVEEQLLVKVDTAGTSLQKLFAGLLLVELPQVLVGLPGGQVALHLLQRVHHAGLDHVDLVDDVGQPDDVVVEGGPDRLDPTLHPHLLHGDAGALAPAGEGS